ncbi:pimeloyl-ACP methyl ester carboxylesterase [Microbacterium sp. SORGH_AS 1204]|uniref:alpha/beta fold hydrolase n=1 Tax=Microbacterium sp. SORGH_AS_1204 TaxID=3041785 RepID=UPI00278EF35D|nr:alpha/beta hydrolase [Microbacterium sp. SORGH_AS_1204]MDQ1136574.1 pimeloyl-ACP methyl ester carboxylesterase [Microbacterium sp. SORGH_AS_1204]
MSLADLPFAASSLGTSMGEPAIVLPGGPCRGVEYLGDLAGLGDDRSLFVLHPRGTLTTGGLSRGWWTDADDVVLLADALGLDRVDLVGHSAGTRLALAAAVRHPDRVRSLALITPPASWLTGTASDAEALLTDADPEVRAGYRALAENDADTPASFQEQFLRQAPASYAHWTARESAHARVGRLDRDAAHAWFRDIPADAAGRILGADLPPTLVIGGDRDLLTGVAPVRSYADALGASLTMLADCGHYPWIEQPDTFRASARAWLRR